MKTPVIANECEAILSRSDKFIVLMISLFFITNFSFAAEDSKTTMKNAYRTEYTVAGASAAAAAVAYYYGHETLAAMFSQQAISSAVAGYKNEQNYKSFDPNGDRSGGPNFNEVATSLGLNNLPGFKDGKLNRAPAGDTDKEDLDKDMSSLMEDLKGLDASSPELANISKEDLENFLKEGTLPRMPEMNFDQEKSQTASHGTINFMAYGGGDASGSGTDYTSMFQSLFSSKDKLNPDYVGNIPVRYLAQTDDSESIWDRISKTTRKHLKQ